MHGKPSAEECFMTTFQAKHIIISWFNMFPLWIHIDCATLRYVCNGRWSFFLHLIGVGHLEMRCKERTNERTKWVCQMCCAEFWATEAVQKGVNIYCSHLKLGYLRRLVFMCLLNTLQPFYDVNQMLTNVANTQAIWAEHFTFNSQENRLRIMHASIKQNSNWHRFVSLVV